MIYYSNYYIYTWMGDKRLRILLIFLQFLSENHSHTKDKDNNLRRNQKVVSIGVSVKRPRFFIHNLLKMIWFIFNVIIYSPKRQFESRLQPIPNP